MFDRRQVVVRHRGRVYVCGPPTMATIQELLRRFYVPVLLEFAQAWPGDAIGRLRSEPQLRRMVTALRASTRVRSIYKPSTAELVEKFAGLPGMGGVLDTCCRLHRGRPGELPSRAARNAGLRKKLVAAVVESCDVKAIVGELRKTLFAPPSTATSLGEATGDLTITLLAERFGCAPGDVVTKWPYDEYIGVLEALRLQADRAELRQKGFAPGGGPVASMSELEGLV